MQPTQSTVSYAHSSQMYSQGTYTIQKPVQSPVRAVYRSCLRNIECDIDGDFRMERSGCSGRSLWRKNRSKHGNSAQDTMFSSENELWSSIINVGVRVQLIENTLSHWTYFQSLSRRKGRAPVALSFKISRYSCYRLRPIHHVCSLVYPAHCNAKVALFAMRNNQDSCVILSYICEPC